MTLPPSSSSESSSIRAAKLVDSLCDQFETAWKSVAKGGKRPSIVSYLENVSSERKKRLLDELMGLEVHYRRRLGEDPHPADYSAINHRLDPAWFHESLSAIVCTPSIGRQERTIYGSQYRGDELTLPCSFGNYELLEEVARGGMGVVYKARHSQLNRIVALKMILTAELATQAEINRFRAEAEAAAELEHPHIVPIYEVGTFEGRYYYTMKLIEGGSLKQHAPRLQKRPRDIARIMAIVAEAVQFAHSKAILHRDLKPANILLDKCAGTYDPVHHTSPGTASCNYDHVEAFVTDFGLAKRLESNDKHTRTNMLVGTPAYMSPEQASAAGRVGTAADVYALGAILYELITGNPPFQADIILVLLKMIENEEPILPRTLVPDVSRDLETICLKCLSKEPHQRYASAAALADDLRRYCANKPISARPVSASEKFFKWARRKPVVASLAAMLILVTLIGAGMVLWQWQIAVFHESEKGKALQDAKTSLKSMKRSDYYQRIARANLELAANNTDSALQILDSCPSDLRDWEWNYIKGQCHTELMQLKAHTAESTAVRFSPDSKRLASCGADGKVHLWDLASQKRLYSIELTTPFVRSLIFSPDGSRLYIAGGNWMKPQSGVAGIWDAATGKQLASFEGVRGHVWRIALTKDGAILAGTQAKAVILWDALTGARKRSIPFSSETLSVAFSPDGKHLAVGLRDGEIHILAMDEKSPEVKFPAEGDVEIRDLAFNHDGTQLVSSSFTGQVKLWQVARRTNKQLHNDSERLESIAFSPDGKTIAGASLTGPIYLWSATGTRRGKLLRILTGHARETLRVTFSPGGKLLASAGWDGKIRIWDATEPPPPTSELGRSGMHTIAFFPDGKRFITAGKPIESQNSASSVAVWDMNRQTILFTLDSRKNGYDAMAMQQDGAMVAVAIGHEVVLWDLPARAVRMRWNAHESDITAMIFQSETNELITASKDGTVKLWTINAVVPSKPRQTLKQSSPVTVLTANARIVACGYANGQVCLWDSEQGALLDTWTDHSAAVYALAFRPLSNQLASAGADHHVLVRDTVSRRNILSTKVHHAEVTCLAYNPTGTRLVSGGVDGNVIIWDADHGESVLTFRRAINAPVALKFTDDGKRLIAIQGRKSFNSTKNVLTSKIVIWEADESLRIGSNQIQSTLEADQEESKRLKQMVIRPLPIESENNPSKLVLKAWSLAENGKWHEADAESAKAVQNGSLPGVLEDEGFYLAWLRITLGSRDEYLKTCSEIISRYRNASRAQATHSSAWLILVRPNGENEYYEQALQWALNSIRQEPTSPWHWETLALAYLRLRNWSEAIKATDKISLLDNNGLGTECFINAIAWWQLGDKDKARQWYEKGCKWMEENRQRLSKTQTRWLDRRRFQVEAAKMLGQTIPSDIPEWKN